MFTSSLAGPAVCVFYQNALTGAGNAAKQVREAVQGWKSRGVKYGMMWYTNRFVVIVVY